MGSHSRFYIFNFTFFIIKAKYMKFSIILTAAILLLSTSSFAAPPSEVGKTIFSTRCSGCHNINKIVVGPALANVDQRHSIDWIINFVHSSQTLVKNGDKDAVALFNQFNHIQMPDHTDLSADDIKGIVEYIKSESKADGGAEKAPFARPSHYQKPYTPLSISNYGFFITYILCVFALIATLVFFVRVKELGRRNV